MREATLTIAGSISSLYRYPVKSMMGEALETVQLTANGIAGDRAYALIDGIDGKVATAKNPRKWPQLFTFSAAFSGVPHAGIGVQPVRITLPNGTTVTNAEANIDALLSSALDRVVKLTAQDADASSAGTVTAEEYWPDMAGLDHRDAVTDFSLPRGTFFDASVLHIVTTATLARLRELYPQGSFEPRRFRPNLVVTPAAEHAGFVENDWIGHTLRIGETVRVKVTDACGRCVMTTLAQGDLEHDPGILRTAAQYNHAQVGVYAAVLHDGEIREGDAVRLED